MEKTVNTFSKNQLKSFDLLRDFENLSNETHLENLHEIFMCFVRADEDHRPDRDSIIATYESLRQLLIDSNKLFCAD